MEAHDASANETIKFNHSCSIVGRTVGTEVDVFDQAMSWRRAFQRVYMKYNWLKQFGRINTIAIKTITKELAKKLMVAGEKSEYVNMLLGKLEERLPLFNRKASTQRVRALVDNFAKTFTGKDLASALKELNNFRSSVPPQDLSAIAFLSGANLVLVISFCFLVSFKSKCFFIFINQYFITAVD